MTADELADAFGPGLKETVIVLYNGSLFFYGEFIMTQYDKPYKPSKGELAILSLQHDLLTKKDYDIFLIDEPEANLGSTYINDEIVPLLNELARSKKKIVVATHDANIAIRTRPSCSILKVVNNDQYETYIGNMAYIYKSRTAK